MFWVVWAYSYGQDSLFQYYKYVNKAELAICKGHYEKASKLYNKAFSHRQPFARDLSYSFIINYKYVNNVDFAIRDFHWLAKRGIGDLSGYIEDTLKYAVIWNHMKNIVDTTELTINTDLVNRLEKMREDDQSVRARSYDNDDMWFKNVSRTDSINLLKVKELYKDFSPINEYTAKTIAPLNLILLHAGWLGFDPEEIWLEEVKKGNIDARTYMQLRDVCKTEIIDKQKGINSNPIYGTSFTHFVVINNTLFIYEPENIEEINRNRKAINVSETWNDYLKKNLYVLKSKNPDFMFFPRKQLVNTDISMEEFEKQKKEEIDTKKVKGRYIELGK